MLKFELYNNQLRLSVFSGVEFIYYAKQLWGIILNKPGI